MKHKSHIAKGWEVEWCASVPRNESGDLEIDLADYRTEDCRDKESAVRLAQSKLPEDFFGSVRVTPFELVPLFPGARVTTREYTAEAEHIEDDGLAQGATAIKAVNVLP